MDLVSNRIANGSENHALALNARLSVKNSANHGSFVVTLTERSGTRMAVVKMRLVDY